VRFNRGFGPTSRLLAIRFDLRHKRGPFSDCPAPAFRRNRFGNNCHKSNPGTGATLRQFSFPCAHTPVLVADNASAVLIPVIRRRRGTGVSIADQLRGQSFPRHRPITGCRISICTRFHGNLPRYWALPVSCGRTRTCPPTPSSAQRLGLQRQCAPRDKPFILKTRDCT